MQKWVGINKTSYARTENQKNFCNYKCNSLNILPIVRLMVLWSRILFYSSSIFLSSRVIYHSSPISLSPGGNPVIVCRSLHHLFPAVAPSHLNCWGILPQSENVEVRENRHHKVIFLLISKHQEAERELLGVFNFFSPQTHWLILER